MLRSSDVMASAIEILSGELIKAASTGDLAWNDSSKAHRIRTPRFSPGNTRPATIPKSNPSSGSTTPPSQTKKNSPRKKFKWHDSSSGNTLTAGGILFYDDDGIWVVGEKDKNGIVYSDIGGRYNYEDGNIWTSIARELREETYGICEMFASEIVELSKKFPPVYVNGHENKPTYVCLVVPIPAMKLETRQHFSLDSSLFDAQRLKTLSENPDVPVDYYPCLLTKLSYEEIKNPAFRLSYRLKRVLRFSTAFSSIPPRSEQSSPRDSDEDNS